jgi:hypothetical protein
MVDKVINLPQPELTLKQALIKSLQGNADAQSDYFNEVYARLLRAQADIAEAAAGNCSNRRLSKLQDVESEALWEVIKTHAVERYQIGHKLAQLETLLHTGQCWYDQREFFLLASARMDLERAEPLRAGGHNG